MNPNGFTDLEGLAADGKANLMPNKIKITVGMATCRPRRCGRGP